MLTWDTFAAVRQELGRPIVVAHRGASACAPENTLRSFELALTQGADALETDLRFTRDGHIVLVHDETVERTTNGHGCVCDHTLEELRQLYTKDPAGKLSDARIPTLVELIEKTDGRVPLLLELKDPAFTDRDHAQSLIDLLQKYEMLTNCAIVSFTSKLVKSVARLEPKIAAGNITMWNPLPVPGKRLLGPFFPLLYLNPFYVYFAHWMGAIVAPLDPNPVPRLDYYLRLNVDALLADHPAEVLRALETEHS